MIRTLIEVTGESPWDHRDKLEAALDRLGYEPKPSRESLDFRRDLASALLEKGMDPGELVRLYRAERQEAFDKLAVEIAA